MPRSGPVARGFNVEVAHAYLLRSDRKLAAWMRRMAPPPTDFGKPFDPVDALARAILYQQLSGKAAATITARVEALMPAGTWHGTRLSADGLDTIDDVELRAAGVSRQKVAALRDLAAKAGQGVVPSIRKMAWMDNEVLIEQLTQVRGIGRWTVEMLLMFRLGRADILPLADLGIRKGTQILLGSDELPNAAELAERGACWAPYRTLASLYLWRIVEAADPASRARRSQD